MPKIQDHPVGEITKMLVIGDSGGGKTGALVSLAKAGYKLRVLDLDNGCDILANLLKGVKCDVHYETITEKMRAVGGQAMIEGGAKAWTRSLNQLSRWKDSETGEDYGVPSEWGKDTVLVIDSLTNLCRWAMNHILGVNGRLNSAPWMSDWGEAQRLIENLLGLLYSDAFNCNLIVNCHITYIGREVDTVDDKGQTVKREEDVKAYPMSLGRALSPKIGTYFNHALMVRSVGQGPGAKRKLFTNTQGLVELKTSAPGKVKSEYPIETGLADYFRDVRGA